MTSATVTDAPADGQERPTRRRRPRAGMAFTAAVAVSDLVAVLGAAALSEADWDMRLSYVVAVVVLLRIVGPQHERIDLGLAAELPLIARYSVLALVAPLVLATGSIPALPTLVQATGTFVFLALARGCCYLAFRAVRRRGHLQTNAVVVGDGSIAAELVATMRAHPEYGLRHIGDDPAAARVESTGSLDICDRLEESLAAGDVDKVIVAFGSVPDEELVPVLRSALRHDVDLFIVPRLYQFAVAGDRQATDHVWGFPLCRLERAAQRRAAWKVKRVIDVVFASVATLLLGPLMVITASALRLASPGPVFFRQTRIAQGGRPFGLLKFRTLRVAPASDEDEAVKLEVDDEQAVQQSRRRDVDDRSTRLGRIARTTSLDELPQLWNIMRGEMSLVGPRPEEARYARMFADLVPEYSDRHRVPVGLTGWAQVHDLRGETSIAQRVRFDNYYVDRWSLYRDMIIIFRTFTAVWRQVISERS